MDIMKITGSIGMTKIVDKITMNLITYGCGETFDKSKFKPILNSYCSNKPAPGTGLWTSPVDSYYGWRHWCEAENFGDLSVSFLTTFTGNIATINSYCDLDCLSSIEGKFRPVPDFERIFNDGIDAIFLTEHGQEETRYSHPKNLYGWDCECLLIMNLDCISEFIPKDLKVNVYG